MSHNLVPLSKSELFRSLIQIPIIPTEDENVALSKDIMIIPLTKVSEATTEYKMKLATFVKGIIKEYVSDSQTIIDKLVNNTTLPLWVAAFTDFSYDPNPDMNNERLEKVGDNAAGAAFNLYLQGYVVPSEEDKKINRGPSKGNTTLSEAEISNINHYYMSTIPQAQIAKKLGLGQFIRSTNPVVASTLENVFESFVGALYRVAFTVGLPRDDLVYNLILTIFTEDPINLYVGLGDPKTRVLQYATKRHWTIPVIMPDVPASGGVLVIIELSDQNYLNAVRNEAKVGNPSSIIGQGVGSTQLVAEKNAFINALSLWESYGFFSETYMSNKVRPNYEQAMTKARKAGYKEIYPVKLKSTNSYQSEGLVGVEKEGGKRVFLTQVLVRIKPKETIPRDEMAITLYTAYVSGQQSTTMPKI